MLNALFLIVGVGLGWYAKTLYLRRLVAAQRRIKRALIGATHSRRRH